MTELPQDVQEESEYEVFPVTPRYHPVHRLTRKIYDFLASSRLAMFLLVMILGCCVAGVTFLRGEVADTRLFNSLWFNGLLVLLIINVACCFFGRIWGRRVTIISFGMILFHLSFVAMFAGIVYNSLFFFRGIIRLTEGETLPNSDPQSYDIKERGRFFRYSRLQGDTTLNKMETHYKVDGLDKRVAYDISVGHPGMKKSGIIYLTRNLDYYGVRYFPEKQGYSVLTVIYDKSGKELHGAYLPLQTLMESKGGYIHSSGSKKGPGSLEFPRLPEKPLLDLQVAYRPDPSKERAGVALFQVRPLGSDLQPLKDREPLKGEAAIGAQFAAGDYLLSVKEVRYWVGMKVVYEPGQPIVLASLWAGLAGLIITFFGRVWKKRRNAAA